MVSARMIDVTVRVPEGCEGLMVRIAEGICEEFPGGPDREARAVQAQSQHDARVQRGLEIVYGVLAKYRPLPNREQEMARDANSRVRDWFVRFGDERWPLKALYWHVLLKLPGDMVGNRWSASRSFHTAEAREFMQGLGLTVQKGRK